MIALKIDKINRIVNRSHAYAFGTEPHHYQTPIECPESIFRTFIGMRQARPMYRRTKWKNGKQHENQRRPKGFRRLLQQLSFA